MIALTVVSETAKTLTLGWTPTPSAIGYEFYVDGRRVSNSWNGALGQVVFGKPDSGEHTYQVLAVGQLGEHTLQHPVVTPPPPDGWTVAAPGSTGQKVTTINDPAGAGVNIYQAKATISDTIVNAGQDQAFLTQGGQSGGAGSLFQRIQGNAVGGYSVSGNNKHFFYAKAANVTILDAAATAATTPHQGDGGFSVRYAGFLAQRFTLDGFQLPLCVFADDQVKGQVIWRQGKVTNPRNTPVYLDCDEAAKMVYDIVCDQIDFSDWMGPLFVANTANFAGTLTVNACTLNGKPIVASQAGTLVRGIPAAVLKIT